MARVKVCGVCWKPVNECICDDEDDSDDEEEPEPAALVPDFYRQEIIPDTGNVNCYFG